MFRDRTEAGRRLADALLRFRNESPVVMALPRGGVPVAFEVATALEAPLDLVLIRKIGAPLQPELAVGAVVDGEHPETVVNEDVAAFLGITEDWLKGETERKLAEIEERRQRYLSGRPRAPVRGHTAIVIDDGIATGATMRAALRAIRRQRPRRLVLAVPVAPADTVEALRAEADEIVCLDTPEPFGAIGAFYLDFRQTGDDEVVDMLARAPRPAAETTEKTEKTEGAGE